MQRVNNEVPNIDATVSDINSEFPNVEIDHIQKAIRKGSLGDYGRTFRMSTQEVCIWVRDYCRDKGIIYDKTKQIRNPVKI